MYVYILLYTATTKVEVGMCLPEFGIVAILHYLKWWWFLSCPVKPGSRDAYLSPECTTLLRAAGYSGGLGDRTCSVHQ